MHCIVDASTQLEFTGCSVQGCATSGFIIRNSANNVTITNTYFENIALTGFSIDSNCYGTKLDMVHFTAADDLDSPGDKVRVTGNGTHIHSSQYCCPLRLYGSGNVVIGRWQHPVVDTDENAESQTLWFDFTRELRPTTDIRLEAGQFLQLHSAGTVQKIGRELATGDTIIGLASRLRVLGPDGLDIGTWHPTDGLKPVGPLVHPDTQPHVFACTTTLGAATSFVTTTNGGATFNAKKDNILYWGYNLPWFNGGTNPYANAAEPTFYDSMESLYSTVSTDFFEYNFEGHGPSNIWGPYRWRSFSADRATGLGSWAHHGEYHEYCSTDGNTIYLRVGQPYSGAGDPKIFDLRLPLVSTTTIGGSRFLLANAASNVAAGLNISSGAVYSGYNLTEVSGTYKAIANGSVSGVSWGSDGGITLLSGSGLSAGTSVPTAYSYAPSTGVHTFTGRITATSLGLGSVYGFATSNPGTGAPVIGYDYTWASGGAPKTRDTGNASAVESAAGVVKFWFGDGVAGNDMSNPFSVDKTGAPLLPTLSDAAAPNGSIFFGSDHLDGSSRAKICRKQGGVVTEIG